MLNNSRFMLANTSGKYGNKSALKRLFFQTNKNGSIKQLSSSPIVANSNQTESAPKQKKSSGFKIVALALTGFTVGLGFAVLNPDSRRQIQATIPQANQFFDLVDDLLGHKKTQPSVKVIEAPKIEPLKPVEVPKEVVVVVEAVPVVPEPPVLVVQVPAPVETPVLSTQQSTQTETAASEPALDLDWKKTLKRHELQEEATIDAIETKLTNYNSAVNARIAEADLSITSAIDSLNKYSQALRKALDENKNEENKDQQWKEVTDLFYIQSFNVNETNQKVEAANKAIQDLETLLKEVKSSDLNVKNLRQTQIDLIDQCRKFQAEKLKLSEAVIHANVLRTFTNEQKVARSQFLKEMQALQPDGIQVLNRSEDQLTNEEINNLLIHAHKRVLQLQKQIEKIQTQQSQQIQEALEEQRKQNAQLQKENEANLYELCQREFSVEKEKILENEKQKTSEEIKKELSRQAAAHNNHLAQMLKLQQDELQVFYEKKLAVLNEKTRKEFYAKVADSLGRIRGIENAINARANLELQANNAKQLWLAVQNLNELLNKSAVELNLNQEIVSIKSNIDMIKQSAPENEFIQGIISSVPGNALEGVWTEPDLKERFYRLKNACSRVALIDERGGSLFKYFISYLQSFFIMHAKIDTHQTAPTSLEDINLNSTFSILDHAQYFIENGNIESAVRLLQQLRGEPYRLARDWIREAILLLEIKQACHLLTAYISSVYITANYK